MKGPSYRERAREDILRVAESILANEGLEAVQARRIAAQSNCAIGTIYNVFGDIDGLIIAVNGRTLAALGRRLEASAGALPEGAPLRDRLLVLALAYTGFAVDNQRRWEAVFKHRQPAGQPVPEWYLAEQARLLALIEVALAGGEHDRPASEAAARALFGAVHGIVALALDNRLGGTLRRELETQVRFVVDVLARGLAHGGASQGHTALHLG